MSICLRARLHIRLQFGFVYAIGFGCVDVLNAAHVLDFIYVLA